MGLSADGQAYQERVSDKCKGENCTIVMIGQGMDDINVDARVRGVRIWYGQSVGINL